MSASSRDSRELDVIRGVEESRGLVNLRLGFRVYGPLRERE
jgi:hypothetical protein